LSTTFLKKSLTKTVAPVYHADNVVFRFHAFLIKLFWKKFALKPFLKRLAIKLFFKEAYREGL
jgi:hypothetical protein